MEHGQSMAVPGDDRQYLMKSPERWQEVKEILYPALELGSADRTSFLDQKCGDDVELRREIE